MGIRTRLEAPRQLTLDLSRDPSLGIDDFLASPSNAEAFERIDLWPRWSGSALTLVGPPGSGKTHLAMVWARRASAYFAQACDLLDPARLAAHGAVVLDGCEELARDEATLFHFLNLMREQDRWLLITARRHPVAWGLNTADLLSRLRLYPAVTMQHPSPDLVRAVLVKLFDDRQIRIEEDVVTYAAFHLEQSLEAVRDFVQAIDDVSLAAGRKISRQLAAATIASMRHEEV